MKLDRISVSLALLVLVFGNLGVSNALGQPHKEFPSAIGQAQLQQVAVLISNDSEAPSIEAILDNFKSKTKKPILNVLANHPPDELLPLISRRATGDALMLLEENPEDPRAVLERYLVLSYETALDLNQILEIPLNDAFIDAAYDLGQVTISASPFGGAASSQSSDWNIDMVNAPAARDWVGTGARIGVVDSGIQIDHPGLSPFALSGSFVGGPFSAALSIDYSRKKLPTGEGCPLVDERTAWMHAEDGLGYCEDYGVAPVNHVGHGTHVAGIATARAEHSHSGVCPGCALAVGKYRNVLQNIIDAVVGSTDAGAAVINMSWGQLLTDDPPVPVPTSHCANEPQEPRCLMIAHALSRGAILVGAAGNNRMELQFPASDSRVVAVGGVDQIGDFWDESPGTIDNCPLSQWEAHPELECGSNFSFAIDQNNLDPNGLVDLVAPAKAVPSLKYTGYDYNPFLGCAEDEFQSGTGLCTGTSMAAPHVVGIMGLMRAVNPLVRQGSQDPGHPVPGIRTVLNESGHLAQANQPHHQNLGYGIPDAEFAVKRLLGVVGGVQMTNRLTPLFSQYSPGSGDHHYTISPQIGQMKFSQEQHRYWPIGGPISGFVRWPMYEGGMPGPLPPSPEAQMYVFTTKQNPFGVDPMVPLYRLTYKGASSGNPDNKDMVIVISPEEINGFVSVGYRFEGQEGFLLPLCSPEPACIPEGAVRVHRRYNEDRDDHAIFPEHLLPAMEQDGYMIVHPGYAPILGYAYPNVDSDGDGLIDGIEILIGTDPQRADSNCDGILDGQHYPLAWVPVGDPLDGDCGADLEVTALNYDEYGLVIAGMNNYGPSDSDGFLLIARFEREDEFVHFSVSPTGIDECDAIGDSFCSPGGPCEIMYECVIDHLPAIDSIFRSFQVNSNCPATAHFEFELVPTGQVSDPYLPNNLLQSTMEALPFDGDCAADLEVTALNYDEYGLVIAGMNNYGPSDSDGFLLIARFEREDEFVHFSVSPTGIDECDAIGDSFCSPGGPCEIIYECGIDQLPAIDSIFRSFQVYSNFPATAHFEFELVPTGQVSDPYLPNNLLQSSVKVSP